MVAALQKKGSIMKMQGLKRLGEKVLKSKEGLQNLSSLKIVARYS